MSSSWTAEVETKAPAAAIFKAAFLDWHNLGPKLIPQIITGVTLISGDGSSGSIRQINFSPVMPFSFIKERLDFIDHEKLELKTSVVEGGDLGNKIESATSHIKVEPKGNSSIVKVLATYKAIAGVDVAEDIKKAKEGFINSVKAVEEHLVANPGAYA
ncbi:pathogenesis-related protein 1-like [Dendrobium catenatum]|uniref:Pathogenesis-related protein 1 n=1 Tax=Dendrobium catenatum TaxID=906689 RepID=A0A2I0VWR5_9ASPA|nr:pathogenesis-related protein 1-like [Dendrobium catenatum]PKU67850.1 Pathogenesis-related protein 1 [Dendrobium catenatum]